jgi:hypothetical protein
MEYGLGTRGGFAIVVLVGVLVPGLTNHFLSQAGFHTVGSVLWYAGYGVMALVLWYGWVRPLEFSEPDTEFTPESERDSD